MSREARMLWLRLAVAGGCLALLMCSAAMAEEALLARDDGTAQSMEYLNTELHFVKLESPRSWKETYAEEVQFYGQRYGDVGARLGTVVIWVPKASPKVASRQTELGEISILTTKQFALADVPETPGWFPVPVDTVKLPVAFGISVYTFSDENGGVKIGLTGPGNAASASASTYPGAAGGMKPIKFRRDKRNWMLRLKVRSVLAPPAAIDPAELAGSRFLAYDDGSAEGFVTLRRKGFLLRCENSGPRQVDGVYFYGKLEGQWFGSSRVLTVMVLDKDMKVLSRVQVPYSKFSNTASWGAALFSPVIVDKLHYISVEPSSTENTQFMLGYDSSSANVASGHGTTGALLPWPFETPAEANTNWMIRVRYAQ